MSKIQQTEAAGLMKYASRFSDASGKTEYLSDLHVHTSFCDGNASPENMLVAALKKHMNCIGFSGHSYTFFDDSYCMSPEGTERYRAIIAELKQKYGSRIEILCGVEQDYWSEASTEGFEYVIGSVHYLKFPLRECCKPAGNNGAESGNPCGVAAEYPEGFYPRGDSVYVAVDWKPEILRNAADMFFGGDMQALAIKYFETVGGVAEKTGADMIGHFDLISKFCETAYRIDGCPESGPIINTEDPAYIAAWKAAADRLLAAGIPFEINTGAMSRGYRTSPYPSAEIRDYIRANGGQFILSGDAHSTEALCFGFELL